ncbi:MAG: NADH-quinone oxidoreductase chain 5 [Bacteroidetes bacterium]|nr:MAG: NADH-quinone oxidoreductase chain 5 [Bacteroidota bacterium]
MSNEELKSVLSGFNPGLTFEESGEWLVANVEPGEFLSLAKQIRNNESLSFDYLFCLTCIDWKTHLTMVYHLTSTSFRHHLVIKSKLDSSRPEIETVSNIWKTADFHEREVAELFGVNFLNHPDLRKLILPDEWSGFPLRKNYEDPVNMIKL